MTAKEVDALEAAICKAEQDSQKYADTEDGGTCNFDAPKIRLKATPRQLAAMDWRVYKIGRKQPDGFQWYEIGIYLSGQGNRRTRMAKAAAESLKASGYESGVYYQMD